MNDRVTVFIALIFLVGTGLLVAEQKVPLTIDEAIQIGLDKSKGLHSSLMNVQYADSKSSEAGALLLPSVKFNGAYARLSDIPPTQVSLAPLIPDPITLSPTVLNNYTLRVTVQQPLFTGYKLQRTADIAEYNGKRNSKRF